MKVTREYLKKIISESIKEAKQTKTEKKYSELADRSVRSALAQVSGKLHDAYSDVKKNKGDAEKYLVMWERLNEIYTEAFGGNFGTKPGESPAGPSSDGGYDAFNDRGGGSGYPVASAKGERY